MRNEVSVARAIQNISRPVFATREIAALRGSSLSSTSQSLKRMERQGLIVGTARGLWCIPSDPRFMLFALVPFLAGSHRAYVSFFSALHLHGVIEQIPRVVYAATTGHTRSTNTPVGTYSFHRIQPSFFDGFDWYRGRQDFLIATPEKALVDCLYLSSRRGKPFGFFPEMDLGGTIDLRRAKEWVQRISDTRIRRYASEHLAALQRRSRKGA